MSVRFICARKSDKVDNGKIGIKGNPIDYPSEIEMYVNNICYVGSDYYVTGDDIILPTFETLIDELFPQALSVEENGGLYNIPGIDIDTRAIDLLLFKHVIPKSVLQGESSYVPSMCSKLVILKMINKYCYDGEFNLFIKTGHVYSILEFIIYVYKIYGFIPKFTNNNFDCSVSIINGKLHYSAAKYKVVMCGSEMIEVTASINDYIPRIISLHNNNSMFTFENGEYDFGSDYARDLYGEIKIITTMKSARK